MFNKYKKLKNQIERLNEEVFPKTYYDSFTNQYVSTCQNLVHKRELNNLTNLKNDILALEKENERLKTLLNEVIDYVYRNNE